MLFATDILQNVVEAIASIVVFGENRSTTVFSIRESHNSKRWDFAKLSLIISPSGKPEANQRRI